MDLQREHIVESLLQLLGVRQLELVCLFLTRLALVEVVLIDKLDDVGGEEAVHELLLDLWGGLLSASEGGKTVLEAVAAADPLRQHTDCKVVELSDSFRILLEDCLTEPGDLVADCVTSASALLLEDERCFSFDEFGSFWLDGQLAQDVEVILERHERPLCLE